jgi:hypothetical protein
MAFENVRKHYCTKRYKLRISGHPAVPTWNAVSCTLVMEVRWIHTRSQYRCTYSAIETSQVHPCMVKFTSTQSWRETLLCPRLRFGSWELNEMTIWCQNTYTVTQIEDEDWPNNTVGFNKKFSVPLRGRVIFGTSEKVCLATLSSVGQYTRDGRFAGSRASLLCATLSQFRESPISCEFPIIWRNLKFNDEYDFESDEHTIGNYDSTCWKLRFKYFKYRIQLLQLRTCIWLSVRRTMWQ